MYFSLPELGLGLIFMCIVVTPLYPIAMMINRVDSSYEILNSTFNLDSRKFLGPISQYAFVFSHTLTSIGGTIWTVHAALIGILSMFLMIFWIQVGTGSSGGQSEKGNNKNAGKKPVLRMGG